MNNKNLITLQTNNKLTISKTKSLLSLKTKLISKKKNELVDDSWMERLWEWADENGIPDLKYNANRRHLIGLPRNKQKLLDLKLLALQENNLKEMPKEIGYLSNIEEINLCCNEIKKLPKEIGKLKNLRVLDLIANQLTELPKEIGNLTNLTWLVLSLSELRELPKDIGNLTRLVELDLEFNELTELPREIGKLINLTNLYLGNNNLTSIPKEIGSLTKLAELYLSDNQLKELPKEISNLKNLTELILWGNPNLILTQEQKAWIKELEKNGCDVSMDDDLFDRSLSNKKVYKLTQLAIEAGVESIEQVLAQLDTKDAVIQGYIEVDMHYKLNDKFVEKTNTIELDKSSVQGNFMSNNFNGLLVDINNINGIEINGKILFLRTKYSEKILICEYEYEYEAKEDKMVFQGVLNNNLCKVVLIDENYGLRGYPSNSEEYRELQMGFNYAVIDGDEISF